MPIIIMGLVGFMFLTGFIWLADRRLQTSVKREAEQLLKASTITGTFRHEDLEHLPLPIKNYLKRSVPDGYPLIQTVRLKQTGTMAPAGDSWIPFKAVQYFTLRPMGFIWLAYGRLMPFVWVAARDKYISGKGNMLIKPQSAVTIADATGPQMDQGSLSRFFAEAMWFPTMLLDESIRWQSVNNNKVKATICDHGIDFTMTFTFNADYDLVQVEGLRYRETDKDAEPILWGGKVRDYGKFDGVRIPSQVEVYWHPESGYAPYWRGTIIDVEYNKPEVY